MSDPGVKLTISAKDEASKAVKAVNAELGGLAKSGLSLKSVFGGTFLGMGAMEAVKALGRESIALARSFVDSAREAEGMRGQLTLLEGSKADAVLAAIRAEIGQIPVSLSAATAAYVNLRAGGIQPAIADLQAMADLAGNMRGDASANIEGLASAMARLSTAADLGADGLKNQLLSLTQQGIPAMEILRDRLHLTTEQMEDLGKAGVSGRDVVQALFSWMRDEQGKTADGFDDLTRKMKNSWQELQRQVMEAGPFDAMKQGMSEFTEYMNSARGQIDIRNLLLDIADTTAIAAKAMITAMMPVARTFQIIGTYAAAAKFLLSDDKYEQTKLRAANLREAYTKGRAGARPYDYDQRKDIKRQMDEAEASLKDLESRRDMAAALFAERDTSMFGSETAAEAVLKRVNESIETARQNLAESRKTGPAAAGPESAAGKGLPTATRFLNDTGWLRRMEAETKAETDKTVDAMLQEWNEQQQKASAQAIQIRANLVDQTKSLTLNQADYQRWVLDEEIKGLREYAEASQSSADQVAAYKKAKLAEIAQAEAESARKVQEQIEELNRQMTLPQAGRFEQERAGVQAEFLQRSRDLAEQRARNDITPEQEREVRTKLNEWRDYKFGEIGQRAGDDFSAGWGRGMQEMLDQMKTGFEQAEQLAQDTARAMSQGFGDFFFDAMQGKLKTFGDYVNSFLTSIQRSIANMMGEMVTRQIITGAMGYFGGAAAGAGYMGDGNVTGGVAATAANGAVWRGGFRPFAAGGVVTGPTLGLVGEGRYNEAIVPLPDGRSIPVALKGGGQAINIRVEVKNQSGQQVQATAEQPRFDAGEWVIGVTLDAITRNRMGLRDAVRGA